MPFATAFDITNLQSVLNNEDALFSNPGPSSGTAVTPPTAGGANFTVTTSSKYYFGFGAIGNAQLIAPATLQQLKFAIYNNGNLVLGSEFASSVFSEAKGTSAVSPTISGSGIIQLATGTATLRNLTGSAVQSAGDGISINGFWMTLLKVG